MSLQSRFEDELERRLAAERALSASERRSRRLLATSRRMQEHLRRLSHRLLRAQEEERKEISRELHDEIGQTLTGINVTLAALRHEAGREGGALARRIARTQHLVETSMERIHRFARELRPPLLDDLGLIPALHAHLRGFTRRTKIRVRFSAYADIEKLGTDKRTALYRVAQEALRNVDKHARARLVTVSLETSGETVRMDIHDDGRSFAVDGAAAASMNGGLGLLGMRERLEMVGGSLDIQSARGRGTNVRATVPAEPPRRRKR